MNVENCALQVSYEKSRRKISGSFFLLQTFICFLNSNSKKNEREKQEKGENVKVMNGIN